jgi:hypothetical protein
MTLSGSSPGPSTRNITKSSSLKVHPPLTDHPPPPPPHPPTHTHTHTLSVECHVTFPCFDVEATVTAAVVADNGAKQDGHQQIPARAAALPISGPELVPFTREKTSDGAILFCANSAYDTACIDQTVKIATKGAEFCISVSRPQSQPTAVAALPAIIHKGDQSPVHTTFVLDDDLVNAPFVAHRTTRGLALVFSLLPRNITTGPERHTAVPKVYTVGGALGSLQVKAFGSSRGNKGSNSEKSTASGKSKQGTGESLPVDLFKQVRSSRVVPVVKKKAKRKATPQKQPRAKQPRAKKRKQDEPLKDDQEQVVDPEKDEGTGEADGGDDEHTKLDPNVGDFVVCREVFDSGKEGIAVYRIDGPAEDREGYNYFPYTQFATSGRCKSTSRKVLGTKFSKVLAGGNERLAGFSVVCVFPKGLIKHLLPPEVQEMVKDGAVWKLMTR